MKLSMGLRGQCLSAVGGGARWIGLSDQGSGFSAAKAQVVHKRNQNKLNERRNETRCEGLTALVRILALPHPENHVLWSAPAKRSGDGAFTVAARRGPSQSAVAAALCRRIP